MTPETGGRRGVA